MFLRNNKVWNTNGICNLFAMYQYMTTIKHLLFIYQLYRAEVIIMITIDNVSTMNKLKNETLLVPDNFPARFLIKCVQTTYQNPFGIYLINL